MRQTMTFALFVYGAGIASMLAHELGHCLFYWMQGVPAGMSLMKEFPLRNVTASEYALGSAGGPFTNIVLITVSLWLYKRHLNNPTFRMIFSSFIVGNVCYFVLRGLIALLKKRGGELTDIAGMLGLGYGPIVFVYGAISVAALSYWMRLGGIKWSFRRASAFLALLAGYVLVMVGIETIDSRLFWSRFPTIEIDDGRSYNTPIR